MSQRPLAPPHALPRKCAPALRMHHAKLTIAYRIPPPLPAPAALLCSMQRMQEPPSRKPDRCSSCDLLPLLCPLCYRQAAGRGARLTASVVVHAGLRKHRVVLDLRLAERRAVARDQHELCCVIKIRQGVRFVHGCAWRCFASCQGHGSRGSTWQRRTFALTQSLQGRFVAHGDLARLHDESQTRVDALNSRLLLLQSTNAEAGGVRRQRWPGGSG